MIDAKEMMEELTLAEQKLANERSSMTEEEIQAAEIEIASCKELLGRE